VNAEKPKNSHPNAVLTTQTAAEPIAIQVAIIKLPKKSKDLDAFIFSSLVDIVSPHKLMKYLQILLVSPIFDPFFGISWLLAFQQ
jgi:hypothetical protein